MNKVYITHEEMTRFWITLEQSFATVVFALANMKGSEIFIPKIPSMKIVDLFEILAPGVEKEIIGIRPGEKLHEALLTKEESRHALELEKYFVILPEFKNDLVLEERYHDYFTAGKRPPENYFYSSDCNCDNLNREDFLKIIAEYHNY